jgi:hypothetical protein
VASPQPAFLGVAEGPGALDLEHGLDPRRRHVRVLPAGP